MNIKRFLAELKIAFNVGQSYAYDFRYPIIIAIGLKVYFPSATPFVLGLITLALIILAIILGKIDLRWIRFHQMVADISTEKYNPAMERLINNVKELKKRKI